MSDYSVGVKVDVDSSELDTLESRINKLNDKMVNVDVNANKANKQLADLMNGKSAGTRRINVEADTSRAKRTISSLNGVVGRGMKPIEFDIDFKNIERRISDIEKRASRLGKLSPGSSGSSGTYAQMKRDLADIARLTKDISKMDMSTNPNEFKVLDDKLKELREAYRKTFDDISRDLTSNQRDSLDGLLKQTEFQLERIKAKTQDAFAANQEKERIKAAEKAEKERTKAAEAEAKKLIGLQKELGDARVGYANASDDKELTKYANRIRDVRREIDLAKKSIDDLTDGRGLTDVQNDELSRQKRLQEQRVQDVRDKNRKQAEAVRVKVETKDAENAFKELLRIENQIGKTKIDLVNASDEQDVAKLASRLKDLQRQARETEQSIKNMTAKQIEDYGKVIDKQNQNVADAQDRRVQKSQADYLKRLASEADAAQSILNKRSNIDAGYGRIGNDFDRIRSQSRDAAASVDKLRSSYEGLQRAATAYGNNRSETNARNLIAAEKSYQNALQDTNGYLKQTVAAEKQRAAAQKEAASISRLNNSKKDFSLQIDRWLNNNTAAVASFGDKIRHLQTQIESCDNIQLGNLKTQFKEITTEAQLAGKTGLRTRDSLGKKAKEYASYFGTASLAFEGAYAIQEMARNVLAVDTAMTGLRRVTDLTSDQYEHLYDGLTVSAKEYGVTLVDLINSTADWSRAGFDANTAKGLAEVTTMYQHIADLDYKTASQNLLTAYKGFESELTSPEMFGKDDVAAVGYIGDILNELDNNYSVTAAGIGEALKRSASSLDVAGNSIQETAGMVTGITEVTQDPAKAGNALKVLSMRLRGMKGELVDMGEETDENVENLSRMQGQVMRLTRGEVNIFDDSGEFKSTYDIMDGIAEVWDDLNTVEQADLLETIAGKHRANDVASLINNWDNVEAAVESATNATGSASREHEKYVDSLQGKLDTLTASFQDFSTKAFDSDSFKGFLDIATAGLDALGSAVEKVGVIPLTLGTIAAGLSAVGSDLSIFKYAGGDIKDFDGGLMDAARNLEFMGSTMGEMKDAFQKGRSDGGGFIGGLNSIANAKSNRITKKDLANIKEYNRLIKHGADAEKAYNKTMLDSSRAARDAAMEARNTKKGTIQIGADAAEAARGIDMTAGAMIKAKAASIGLRASLMALNAAATMGLAVLAQFALEGIIKLANHEKELANKVKDVTNSYNEQKKSLKDAKSVMNEVAPKDGTVSRYEELSRGVSSFGENMSLTAAEYSEYNEIVGKIANQFPSLVKGYDSQGNAILTCKGNLEELNAAYDEMGHKANKDVINSSKDIENNFKNALDDAKGRGFWGNDLNIDDAEFLEKALSSDNIEDAVNKYTSEGRYALAKAFQDRGLIDESLDINWDNADRTKAISDAIKGNANEVKAIIEEEYAVLDESVEGMKSQVQARLSDAFDFSDSEFGDMNENLKSVFQGVTADMDASFFKNLKESGQTIEGYVNNMLDGIKKLSSHDMDTLSSAIDSKVEFDGGDITLGEYQDKIAGVKDAMDGLNAESQNAILFELGLEYDEPEMADIQAKFGALGEEGQKEIYAELGLNADTASFDDAMAAIEKLDVASKDEFFIKLGFKEGEYGISKVTKDFEKLKDTLTNNGVDFGVADSFLRGLKSDELSAVKSYFEDMDGFGETFSYRISGNAEEQEAQLRDLVNVAKVLADIGTIDIAVETEGLEKLNNAIKESNSATGVTAESIDGVKSRYGDLDSFDASSVFIKTADGVRLATKEIKKYEQEYVAARKKVSDDNLFALAKEQQYIEEAIGKTAEGSSERKAYESQLGVIKEEIESVQLQAAMYDGLTSSYNNWVNAQQSGQSSDMYDSIVAGKENAQKLADEGKWGNTELQSFIEMMNKPGDFNADSTPQDYANAWGDAIYKANRYFTEGKEGITAFANDVNRANTDLLEVSEDGTSWTLNDGYSIEDWMEASDMDASQINALFGDMEQYGIEIPVSLKMEAQEAVKTADEIVAEVEEKTTSATEALKPTMGEDFSIKANMDIDFTNGDAVGSEIDNLVAKRDEINNSSADVQVKADGVDAVNAQIDLLIRKKIEASQPSYMQLDASQVKSSMQDALVALQNYKDAADELSRLEQLQAKGVPVDTAEFESAQTAVQETAQALADLPPEVKVAMGLEGEDGVNDIIEKLKNNSDEKITITAETTVEDVDMPDGSDGHKINATVNLEGEEAIADLESKMNAIDDKTIAVTVNLDGEESIADLESKMNAIDDKAINPTVNLTGEEQISDLESKMNAIADKQINPTVNLTGEEQISDLESKMNAIESKQINPSVNLSGEEQISDLESKMNAIESKQINPSVNLTGEESIAALESKMNAIESKQINPSVNLTGEEQVSDLESKMNAISNKVISATVSLDGEEQISTLENQLNSADGKTISVNVDADASQVQSINDAINGIDDKSVYVSVDADASQVQSINDSLSGINDKTVSVNVGAEYSQVQAAKNAIDSIGNNSVSISVGAEYSQVQAAKNAIDSIGNNSVSISVGAEYSQVQAAKNAIDSIGNKTINVSATATYKIDTSAVDGYQPSNKSATAKYSVDSSAVDSWAPPDKSGTAYYTPQLNGTLGDITGLTAHYTAVVSGLPSPANGTAHAKGTAFANGTTGKAFKQGNWGTQSSGVALMGELGRETIVRDGRFFTVGDNGAGFYHYKKGDIIFNHKQTEELFEHGYVTSGGGRGRALVGGTAFASGTAFADGSSDSSSSSSDDSSEEFEEKFDWVEVIIDRIERAIKRLERTANSVYKSWDKRNSALIDQIGKVQEEIGLQQSAYDRYMSQANNVGLSESYASKVRDGSIDIETITDEDLKEKIDDYKEWYEKALDAKDAIDELNESVSELYAQRFENVADEFEGYLGVIEHEKDMLDEFINQSEAKGWVVSTKYYEALQKNERENIEELKKQRDAMTAEMNNAVDSGYIDKYSESW